MTRPCRKTAFGPAFDPFSFCAPVCQIHKKSWQRLQEVLTSWSLKFQPSGPALFFCSCLCSVSVRLCLSVRIFFNQGTWTIQGKKQFRKTTGKHTLWVTSVFMSSLLIPQRGNAREPQNIVLFVCSDVSQPTLTRQTGLTHFPINSQKKLACPEVTSAACILHTTRLIGTFKEAGRYC